MAQIVEAAAGNAGGSEAANKAIADQLKISPSTVKNLLARIFKKSGLSSRSALGKHIDKLH